MKKLYFLLLLFLSLVFVSKVYSQTAIHWQKTIGGSWADNLYSLQQTTDGGYILGGSSQSSISGDKTENSKGGRDYWILKTDAIGNIQWDKTIGGSGEDVLRSLQQTADGGYILGGYSLSNISGDKTENSKGVNDFWIVKTDAMGNIQWDNTIGGSQVEILNSLQQTTDGGYILGGYSDSNISGDKTENSKGVYDYWMVKIDAIGNIQWQKTIGGTSGDWLYSLQQTTDGGYILGGHSDSNISGDKTENSKGQNDLWIVKTDINGNIQWQKTIGGSSNDVLSSLQQTADGGYILAGYSESNLSGDKTENSKGGWDYWILKTDSIGNIQWQKTIGGSGNEYSSSLYQTVDGGYIIGGRSDSNISGDKTENSKGYHDFWIVKTDAIGNILWQKTIGGNSNDYLYSLQQTVDLGYILGGYSGSDISGDKTENGKGLGDYWIVKLTTCPSTINAQISSTTTSLCGVNSITLSADTGTGYSFQWQLNGNNISGATSQTYDATIAGDYNVIVTYNCALDTSNTITITSGAAPSSAITASGITSFCSGGSVTLDANTGTGLTYQWQLDGNNITGATTSSYTATATGNYTLMVSNNCGNSISNIITVYVTSAPGSAGSIAGPTSFCRHTTQTFSVSAITGATNYVWSVPPQATIISGAGTNSITVSFIVKQGDITVKPANQCGSGPLSVLPIQLLKCANPNSSINSPLRIGRDSGTFLFPNPASSEVTIQFKSVEENNITLKLYDIHGRIVKEQNSIAIEGMNEFYFNVEFLSKGIYMIELTTGDVRMMKKLVIQ